MTRSIVHKHKWDGSAAPTLTTDYAYSTSLLINGLNYHTFHVKYTPGTNNKILSLIIQFSKDDENTSDTDSTWTQYGLEAISTGTGTFTATTYAYTGATAGTVYPFHIDLTNTTAYKVRIGVKDNAATTGTVSVTQFSNDR